MGRKADDGEFDEFVEKVSAAGVAFSGLNVEFQSPGNGAVRFGWSQGLSVNDVEVPLNDYLRYDNPFSKTEFGTSVCDIQCNGMSLELDFENITRIMK